MRPVAGRSVVASRTWSAAPALALVAASAGLSPSAAEVAAPQGTAPAARGRDGGLPEPRRPAVDRRERPRRTRAAERRLPRERLRPRASGQQEGDTPSFLHLVSAVRGLNDPDRPDQGGWGGRSVRPDPSKNHWFDDPAGLQTVYRWRPEVQAEFAQRTDWMLP